MFRYVLNGLLLYIVTRSSIRLGLKFDHLGISSDAEDLHMIFVYQNFVINVVSYIDHNL